MPPLWLVNPLWIGLYALTGISPCLIYKQGPSKKAVKFTLGLFFIQFILNAIRPVLMFGWHDLGLTFWSLVLLVGTTLLTIIGASRISRTAMWLLAPVLMWTIFGAVLMGALWQLN